MCKKIQPCICFKQCKGTGDIILSDGTEDLCPCACHDDDQDNWGSDNGYEDQGERD